MRRIQNKWTRVGGCEAGADSDFAIRCDVDSRSSVDEHSRNQMAPNPLAPISFFPPALGLHINPGRPTREVLNKRSHEICLVQALAQAVVGRRSCKDADLTGRDAEQRLALALKRRLTVV